MKMTNILNKRNYSYFNFMNWNVNVAVKFAFKLLLFGGIAIGIQLLWHPNINVGENENFIRSPSHR